MFAETLESCSLGKPQVTHHLTQHSFQKKKNPFLKSFQYQCFIIHTCFTITLIFLSHSLARTSNTICRSLDNALVLLRSNSSITGHIDCFAVKGTNNNIVRQDKQSSKTRDF